jgi:PAS domain S-box-containing protein
MRYTIAIGSVGGAVLFMLLLRGLGVGDDVRPALLVAIAISALYGGFGPGALALALATLVGRDPVVLVTGAVLAAVCGGFRRSFQKPVRAALTTKDFLPRSGSAPPGWQGRPGQGSHTTEQEAPLKEVTSEATWRFHHEQPLDITLPEDEQIEHFYLYSVLAECNDAFARMYGFRSAADVVGTRLVVFLPPSNQENVDFLRRFIRSGYRLEDAESHEINRYGEAKYFVNNLVGIFERGQLIGSWGTQRDVTDLKQAGTQEYSSRLHSTKSSSQ